MATTRDLEVLRAELRADLAETETRMARAIVTGIVASNVTIGALAFVAAPVSAPPRRGLHDRLAGTIVVVAP